MSADLGRAVVRVAVRVEVDRYSPEWLLASAVAESELAGQTAVPVGRAVRLEPVE